MTTDESKDARFAALQSWVNGQTQPLGLQNPSPIYPISDDASFRRYFRLDHAAGSLICVDAPPDKEDNHGFVQIQALLAAAGVKVPDIVDKNLDRGFLLLADLGDELLLDRLKVSDPNQQKALYSQALTVLADVGTAGVSAIPTYSEEKLTEEMQLFPDWFLAQQLGLRLSEDERRNLSKVMELMVENAAQQPFSFVHRDFHSRNLMLLATGETAVIDFQDAVVGPVTYDLVSLLKDCYWRLPRSLVVELVERYRQAYFAGVPRQQFVRWFDLMGFQRHLKCAGIFSRLNLRDGKSGYLKDIPLVLDYLVEVTSMYEELNGFGDWLKAAVVPRLEQF